MRRNSGRIDLCATMVGTESVRAISGGEAADKADRVAAFSREYELLAMPHIARRAYDAASWRHRQALLLCSMFGTKNPKTDLRACSSGIPGRSPCHLRAPTQTLERLVRD